MRYDHPYRGREQYERSVLRPDWGRPHPGDPNWLDGHYHGLRSDGGRWQGSYDRYRRYHADDLGGWGGYDGRYSRPMGGFRRDGLLGYDDRRGWRREPPGMPYREDVDADPEWQGGGVRDDMGYLRQYNSRSPEVRYGHDYRRSFGWAERGHFGNPYHDEGPTREREYGGYNRAGWAPGTGPGPGSRAGWG